ncbi:MAG TPA: transcriptional repressor LexA [Syntrophorhabdaceae bacterium]|nr:transcriptional repressor LexA [Syntrophorhabdaceae bacterium]
MKSLTGMQSRIFEFLRDYVRRYGYPPTIREIGGHFNILWPAARMHLKALEKKGFIRINPTRSRGIEILGLRPKEATLVPVAGRIRAGEPLVANEDMDMHITIDPELFPGGDIFSLRVTGDSMKGAGIFDGDFVIVRRQPTLEHGEIGVVLIGDEATVKRVLFEEGRVILKPENLVMEPVSYMPDEVMVAGKVIGLIRNRI